MADGTVACKVNDRTYVDHTHPSKAYSSAAKSKMGCKAGTNGEQVPIVRTTLPGNYLGKAVAVGIFECTFVAAPTGSPTIQVQRVAQPNGKTLKNTTWNNKPGTIAGSVAVTGSLKSGTTSTYQFDVAGEMQNVCNGDAWWGLQITTTATAANQVYGDQSANPPVLTLLLASPTPAPDVVAPNGVVSLNGPTFAWATPAGITRVRAQVADGSGSFTSPAWDSGWRSSTVGQINPAALGWGGLAVNGTAKLRFAQTGIGGDSDWSNAVTVTRTLFGTLTLTAPTNGGTSTDPMPVHTWTFASQSAFQLTITDAAGRVWFDSGRIAGADQSYTPVLSAAVLAQLPDLATLTSRLRVWDTVNGRVASPGDPTYVEATATWTCAAASGAGSVSNVSAVTGVDGMPAVDVSWTCTDGTVTEFLISRGGVIVARIPATSYRTSSTTWTLRDFTAPGYTDLRYTVAAGTASGGATAFAGRQPANPVSVEPEGLWVMEPISGAAFSLNDAAALDQLEQADSVLIYNPPYAAAPIKKTLVLRGFEAPVSGVLDQWRGRSIDAQLADLKTIRANPSRTCRVAAGTDNIPALISTLSAPLAGDALPGRMTRRVSFRVDQNGETQQLATSG